MTGIAEQARVYGEYSSIPEQFQPAIRDNISFFEIRTEKPINFARQINGPFSVAVSEQFDNIRQRMVRIPTWLTGEFARVRFEVENQKTGLARAFMPDDPWWHNRLHIANNPDLRLIHAYHTRDGMYPGQQVLEEVDILYQEITAEAQEFVIMNALGRIIGSFRTKKEAENDVAANKYKNHSIGQRTIRVYSPAVEDLIRKWRTEHRSRYGWTDCPEFKTIRERVIDKIKQLRIGYQQQPMTSNMTPEQFQQMLVSAIRNMPVEKRRELLQETTRDQINETVFDGKPPFRIPMRELKAEAKKRGVAFNKRTDRETLIKKLREAGMEEIDGQAKAATEKTHAEPPVNDPVTEEEVVT